MNDQGSISQLIEEINTGDEAAFEKLRERYFPHLVEIAKRRLPRHARQESDEEDVAVSVMDSFYRAARENRYPDLSDRGLFDGASGLQL